MFQLFFSLCLVGFISDSCVATTLNQGNYPNYRLNTDIEPIDYGIDVTPHFEPETFNGVCTITLKTSKTNVNTITLHKHDLDITEQRLTKKPSAGAPSPWKIENINITSSDYDIDTEKYTLKLASPLLKDELYVLHFKYVGQLSTHSSGFYQSSYMEGNVKK